MQPGKMIKILVAIAYDIPYKIEGTHTADEKTIAKVLSSDGEPNL